MSVTLSVAEAYKDLRSVVYKALESGFGEIFFELGAYRVVVRMLEARAYYSVYLGEERVYEDEVALSDIYALLVSIVEVYGEGAFPETIFYVTYEDYEDFDEALNRAMDYALKGLLVRLVAYDFVYLEILFNVEVIEVFYRDGVLRIGVSYVDWGKEEYRQVFLNVVSYALSLVNYCDSFHMVQEGEGVRILECSCSPEIMDRLRFLFS